MFRLVVLIAVVAVAFASHHAECDEHFAKFLSKHRLRYDGDEKSKRHGIFCDNMKRVDELNAMGKQSVYGVTKFSDRTHDEIAVMLGRKNNAATPSVVRDVRIPEQPTQYSFSTDASIVDWTSAGMVTPVKNQGQCGSCWAHSCVEQIESEWMLAGNAMWEFSVQQVNSCVKNCFGCGGGDTPAGYEYLMGLPSDAGLGSGAWGPYIQSMTETCEGKRCTEACKDLDITDIENNSRLTGPFAAVTGYDYAVPACTGDCNAQNMTLLAQNIATHGPASICVNAANWSNYQGGGAVMTTEQCGGFAYGDLDHCVQLTGFNAEANPPYWMIRNSWATDWGNNGYIYLQFDETNPCGIANEATFVNLGNANVVEEVKADL